MVSVSPFPRPSPVKVKLLLPAVIVRLLIVPPLVFRKLQSITVRTFPPTPKTRLPPFPLNRTRTASSSCQ